MDRTGRASGWSARVCAAVKRAVLRNRVLLVRVGAIAGIVFTIGGFIMHFTPGGASGRLTGSVGIVLCVVSSLASKRRRGLDD